jgi:hypothetical protein
MGYKVRYSRKEKKANEVLAKQNKQNKKNNNSDIDVLNLPPNFWIDAREIKDDYVFI